MMNADTVAVILIIAVPTVIAVAGIVVARMAWLALADLCDEVNALAETLVSSL